jgi:hypothetical protein
MNNAQNGDRNLWRTFVADCMHTICMTPGLDVVSGHRTKSATTSESNEVVNRLRLPGIGESPCTPRIRFVPMTQIRKVGAPFQEESRPWTLNAGPTDGAVGSHAQVSWAITCAPNISKNKGKTRMVPDHLTAWIAGPTAKRLGPADVVVRHLELLPWIIWVLTNSNPIIDWLPNRATQHYQPPQEPH